MRKPEAMRIVAYVLMNGTRMFKSQYDEKLLFRTRKDAETWLRLAWIDDWAVWETKRVIVRRYPCVPAGMRGYLVGTAQRIECWKQSGRYVRRYIHQELEGPENIYPLALHATKREAARWLKNIHANFIENIGENWNRRVIEQWRADPPIVLPVSVCLDEPVASPRNRRGNAEELVCSRVDGDWAGVGAGIL